VSFAYTPVITPTDATVKAPAWLNNPIYYHNRGNSQFSGENSLYGDFFGLDDLFTTHPQVVSGLTDIYEDLGQGLRHRRLPHRYDEACQRRVLGRVRAGDPGRGAERGQAQLLRLW
jgi:alpha-amylase